MDNRYLMFFIPFMCWVIMLVLIIKDRKAEKEREELYEKQTLSEKWKDSEAQYEGEIQRLIDEIRAKVIEEQDAEELNALREKCGQYTGKFVSEIPVINALFAYKKSICVSQNIEADFHLQKIPEGAMSESEMISLFGNLLDNSIEAAQKCEKGYITVESKVVKGQWLTKVSNSKLETETPLDNDMATTKEDKLNHGIGTKIIKKIIKKNKGHMKLKDYGDRFEVLISLPAKSEK